MLKIRLMRIGAKKKPFYRVVVVDERNKRTGGYIELLGTYNPLTEPKDIKLKQDRIDHWVKQGAQLSTGFLRIIGKAPQRPPRKPKKASKQVTGDSGQVTQQETTKSEIKTEEAKADEVSRLSEAGEVSSESTSPDVHEPDQVVSEVETSTEEAELEKQDQTNKGATPNERPA